MEIFLNKKIIKNEKISEKAIAIYIALRAIYTPNKSTYYVSASQLAYELTEKSKHTKYFIDDVVLGLNELINNDIIDLFDAVSKTDYIVDLSKLFFDSSKTFFVTVEQNEVFKIMSCKNDKMKLLRYFIVLMGTLLNKDTPDLKKGCGAMTQEFLAEESNIVIKTIQNYNKVLEELELIYIYKADDLLYSDGQIKSFTNTYGRLADKDKIISSAKKHIGTYGYRNKKDEKLVKKQTTAHNKGCSIKFSNIKKNGVEKYSYEELQEIYFAMLEIKYNLRIKYYTDEAYEEKIINKQLEPYFSSYDFYVGEEKPVEIQSEKSKDIELNEGVFGGEKTVIMKVPAKTPELTKAQLEQIEVRSEISVEQEEELFEQDILSITDPDDELIREMGWQEETVYADDVEKVELAKFDYQKEFGCSKEELKKEITSNFWNRAFGEDSDEDELY